MRRAIVLASLAAVLGPGAVWVAGGLLSTPEPGAHAAPGLGALTAEEAAGEMFWLAPGLLTEVYAAFGLSDEGAVYDGLATAAAGEALEALYLERAGAMAGGGLAAADQTIHELRMTEARTDRSGERLDVDAEWVVIGIVGHQEHQHVRGNTYRAALTIEPVEGAWRITGFDLLDVDRSDAGEAVEVEGEAAAWWN